MVAKMAESWEASMVAKMVDSLALMTVVKSGAVSEMKTVGTTVEPWAATKGL